MEGGAWGPVATALSNSCSQPCGTSAGTAPFWAKTTPLPSIFNVSTGPWGQMVCVLFALGGVADASGEDGGGRSRGSGAPATSPGALPQSGDQAKPVGGGWAGSWADALSVICPNTA